jgi:hypothetical protein
MRTRGDSHHVQLMNHLEGLEKIEELEGEGRENQLG